MERMLLGVQILSFNPIALRTAKILWSFGHSESNRVLSVDSIFVCIHCPRACSNRKSKKLFRFMKMDKNDGDVPILKHTELHHIIELQIRGGIEDNSKIIFLISQ